ncbi:MAG: hypothetical protein K6L75_15140 [Cellvibrionaceae bacterium]
MSEPKYDIIFRGDVVAGNNIVEVKQRLGQLFKIEAAKVDALFTGRAVPLKRNVDLHTAEKYKAILLKAGAQVSLKDMSKAEPIKAATKVNPSSNSVDSKSSPASVPVKEKPLTLKERLAKAAKEEEALAKIQAKAEAKHQADGKDDLGQEGFVLAPVGAVLGTVKQQSPEGVIQVDTSHLSASLPEGELLAPDEKKPDIVVDIDVSDIDIAEVGADLMAASEKVSEHIKLIEAGNYDLADLGADLLTAAEKPTVPPVEIADVNFDLAPVGSDVGEIKKPTPPPPPDTGSLSLSE